jgi:phosphate transport system permease protein
MAIALIISPSIIFSLRILTESQNSQTIAANIALNFQIADGLQRQALIGTGLMLFVISLGVNLIARFIVVRTGPTATRKGRRRPPEGITLPSASTAIEVTALDDLRPSQGALS